MGDTSDFESIVGEETGVGDDAEEVLGSVKAELVADSELDEGLVVVRMFVDIGVLSGDTFKRIYVDLSCVPVELRVRALELNGSGENVPVA